MKVTSVEKKEKSTVELTIQVEADAFEAAVQKAYEKDRKSISVPGFRKGKAPRKIIEGMYGSGVFYEDAINDLYPEAYAQAIEQEKLDAVAWPKVEIVDVGKEGLTFKALVTVRPEVKLGEYKGLTAEKAEVAISDEDIDNELKPFINRATRMVTVERAAETRLACCNVDSLATLTLYDGRFNEGVVGLVASRLKEKVNRPTIVFAPTDDGALKGSGRSIAGVHLRDALDLVSKALPGAVLRFGGHAMAAGLTLRSEGDLPAFRDAFEKAVRSMVDASVFERVIYTDGGLAPDEITERLVQAIDSQIWGQGFDAPVFANEFRVVRQSLVKDAHTKLILELGGQRFDAIFFRHTETLPGMVRLAYRPNINEFMGRRSVQLVIEAAEL